MIKVIGLKAVIFKDLQMINACFDKYNHVLVIGFQIIMLTVSLYLSLTASHPNSSFDVVLSGVVWPSLLFHSLDFLTEIARILKPSGKLTLTEPTGNSMCTLYVQRHLLYLIICFNYNV